MVRPLAAVVSKYVRGHFCYLAGSADLSGIDRSERDRRCWHGRDRQHRQCSRSRILGMGFRLDNAPRDVRGHVRSSSSLVLVSPEHRDRIVNDDRYVHRPNVLRRCLRPYAGIRCRLFWREDRWPDLRLNADRLELCQRVWTFVHRAHARIYGLLWSRASYRRRTDGGFDFAANSGATSTLGRRSPERGGRERLWRKIVKSHLRAIAAQRTDAVPSGMKREWPQYHGTTQPLLQFVRPS